MSLTVFQDAQQNWIYQSRILEFGNLNYYLDYKIFYEGMYLSTKYNSPYTGKLYEKKKE